MVSWFVKTNSDCGWYKILPGKYACLMIMWHVGTDTRRARNDQTWLKCRVTRHCRISITSRRDCIPSPNPKGHQFPYPIMFESVFGLRKSFYSFNFRNGARSRAGIPRIGWREHLHKPLTLEVIKTRVSHGFPYPIHCFQRLRRPLCSDLWQITKPLGSQLVSEFRPLNPLMTSQPTSWVSLWTCDILTIQINMIIFLDKHNFNDNPYVWKTIQIFVTTYCSHKPS